MFSFFLLYTQPKTFPITHLVCAAPDFRRAGTRDARSCCDRRTCRRYIRGEAREGYAQVSFLGALTLTGNAIILPAPGKIQRDSPAACRAP